MDADVRAAFARLPEISARRDMCDALGDEPDRGALYRVLQGLTRTGALRIGSRGEGQRAATCRETGVDPFPAQR